LQTQKYGKYSSSEQCGEKAQIFTIYLKILNFQHTRHQIADITSSSTDFEAKTKNKNVLRKQEMNRFLRLWQNFPLSVAQRHVSIS